MHKLICYHNFDLMKVKAVLILVLLVQFSMSCSVQNDKTLDGIWELVTIQSKDSLNNWQQAPWMKDGTGLLHYASNGYMSVHFWPDTIQTPNQQPYWYVAQFQTKSDTVFHKRMMHSIPEQNFKTAVRLYEIKEDTLYLSAPDYGFRLTWTKK